MRGDIKRLAIVVACSSALLITGCNDRPFNLSINKIDETGPQKKAVIALSDPQIYTRERLLNDRDDETKFLKQQLDNVNTQDFTPRLKRDIDTMLSIVANLAVKFDPIAGAALQQQAKVGELTSEKQIVDLKQQIAALKASAGAGGSGAGGANANAGGNSPAAADSADLAALKKSIDDLTARLTVAETQIKTINDTPKSPPGLRPNTVNDGTPSEIFRDKMAYRNEVQAALEQAQLDDRHDMVGNNLYRLQFKATIFPGEQKDKYAITRVTILPPLFKDDFEVSQLYLDWLAYVAREMNAQGPGGAALKTPAIAGSNIHGLVERAAHYQVLGPATGSYNVTILPIGRKTGASDESSTSGSDNDAFCGNSGEAIDALRLTSDLRASSVALPDKNAIVTASTKLIRDHCTYFSLPVPPVVDQGDIDLIFGDKTSLAVLRWLQGVTTAFQSWPSDSTSLPSIEDNADGSQRGQCSIFKIGADQRTLQSGVDQSVERHLNELADDFSAGRNDDPLLTKFDRQWAAVYWSRDIVNLSSTYLLAIDRVRSRLLEMADGSINSAALTNLQNYTDTVIRLKDAATELLRAVAINSAAQHKKESLTVTGHDKKNVAGKCASLKDVSGRVWVPDSFYDAVVDRAQKKIDGEGITTRQRSISGQAFAYSTAPSEFAQRISTVASATEALDLMASVAALIPTAGTTVNAAGEMRQVATGHVDAIESVPLIVGFSNNGAANQAMDQFGANESQPSFGWVFGPKVTVDTKHNQLALTQLLVNQPVTADISVPGWWHSARLRVETAWAANFQESLLTGADGEPSTRPAAPDPKDFGLTEEQARWAAEPYAFGTPKSFTPEMKQFAAAMADFRQQLADFKSADKVMRRHVISYEMNLPLQSSPENFEQLSDYVATQSWGAQQKQPVITDVFPQQIAACEAVKVLIGGTDLWRGHQVYLEGKEATDVRVAPDMRGLEATFIMPPSSVKTEARLTVWTQLGKAEYGKLAIVASTSCTEGGDSTPKAKVVPPPALIPDTHLLVQLQTDRPLEKYTGFLWMPDKGKKLMVKIDSADISRDGNSIDVKVPTLKAIHDALNNTNPADGSVFSLALKNADDELSPPIVETGPLYYYVAPLATYLGDGKNLVGKFAADQALTLKFVLPPSFLDVYGTSFAVEAKYSLSGKDYTTTKKPLSIAGKQGIVILAAPAGLPNDAKPTSVMVTLSGPGLKETEITVALK